MRGRLLGQRFRGWSPQLTLDRGWSPQLTLDQRLAAKQPLLFYVFLRGLVVAVLVPKGRRPVRGSGRRLHEQIALGPGWARLHL